MKSSKPIAGRYLGYREADRAAPYAPSSTLSLRRWHRMCAPRLIVAGYPTFCCRTSIVDEYIGSDLIRGAIRFVPPATLGFTDKSLDDDQQATIICARIGLGDAPIDIGYLAHHVRAVPYLMDRASRMLCLVTDKSWP